MTRIPTRLQLQWPHWPLLLGVLVLGNLASCDNPACVFGPTGCQSLPGGGANAVTATFPETGEQVEPTESPRVEGMFPTGFAHPESPLVLIFSESISPPSVQDAFELRTTSGLGTTASPNVALVGDGRVLILIPVPLVPGQEYELAFKEDSAVRDLSGALALRSEEGVIGTFTVDPDPVDEPHLLMMWPLDGAVGTSTMTEIVTVFDRIIDPFTITAASWNILVDGVDPTFDPLPEPMRINGGVQGGGNIVDDSRVWRWRSVDMTIDSRVSLGEGANVTVELSTAIATLGGDSLATITPTPHFTTATYSAPNAVAIMSSPTDAIGIENLGGVNPLMIVVDLAIPAVEGDALEIFQVGTNPVGGAGEVERLSLQRTFPLSAGLMSATIGEDELGLLVSTVPLAAEFADGDVGIGFALRSGGTRSAVRVLDVDLTTDGIQDPVLDLSAPEFLTLLGRMEGETNFDSDLLELSISGFATEEPRSVEVIANLPGGPVDNRIMGQLPPLASFTSTGAFVAAPVNVGQIPFTDNPVNVTLIVYDKAFNASDPVFLQYTQRGSVGPGTSLLGSGLDVGVSVFDALTLQPIVGAVVYSHESVAGVITAFSPPSVTTDAIGFVNAPSAPTGETLITVSAPDYDLFTFQGVPTTRLDVPLTPANVVSFGTSFITASSSGPELSSPFIKNFASDSRVLLPGETLRLADACAYNTLLDQTICTFLPPLGLRLGEVGLVTFLATKDPGDLNDPNLFSAGTFLQAFELLMPRAPLTTLVPNDNVGIAVGDLLSGAGVPPGDIPLAFGPQVFSKPPNFSLDFPNIDGAPRVSVEAFTSGVRGMMTIGQGRPYFDVGNDRWDIRSAYTAKAKAGGELATALTIEDERLLRVEIVDASGNRTGVRQPQGSATGSLLPPGVPLLNAPTGTTAGPAYDLVYENVIDGAQDTLGLYRALLVDSATAKRWHLWTLDPVAGSDVVTHVPPIAIQGGVGLGSGTITCFLDAWSWAGFDPQAFMFSDIVRRHDRFTSASPKVFSQP